MTVVDSDEHPRADTTADARQASPAFKPEGSVTAGNASGINDGAAAVVVMTPTKAREMGLKPLATVEGYASVAVEPRIMGIGPIPAVKKALERPGSASEDIDLFEVNEAFAAQSLAVRGPRPRPARSVNPNGGAIASATRSAPAARASSSRCSTRCSAASSIAAWPRCASAAAPGAPPPSGAPRPTAAAPPPGERAPRGGGGGARPPRPPRDTAGGAPFPKGEGRWTEGCRMIFSLW